MKSCRGGNIRFRSNKSTICTKGLDKKVADEMFECFSKKVEVPQSEALD